MKGTEMTEDQTHNAYANAVSVTLGIYDVALHFSTQSPVAVGGDTPPAVVVTDRCAIRMSPQHAKALAALLTHYILKYEKDYSVELPLPASTQDLWDRHI